MIRKRIIFLFLCLLCGMGISAQEMVVKGRVESKTGEEIPGASVFVKETKKGSMTDGNGDFSMSCTSKSVLQVSCIGYKTKQVSVNGKNFLKVVLEEDDHNLDEVVVVGYGVMRKSDLTGSVASVNAGEALKQMPASNITDCPVSASFRPPVSRGHRLQFVCVELTLSMLIRDH